VLAVGAAILLPGLSGFGVWDPWELATADVARQLNDGVRASEALDARAVVASVGFQTLGVEEWAGRLPIALCGLGLLALLVFVGGRLIDLRTGVYAAAITASTPLFALNSRPIFGSAPSFLLQAATGLALAMAVLRAEVSARGRVAWLCAAAIAGTLATLDGGALRALLPSLIATSAVLLLDKAWRDEGERMRRAMGAVVLTATGIVLVGVVWTIVRDVHGVSPWTGGAPVQQVAPPFESPMQRVFHAFAPWSVMLPMAAAAMLWGELGEERRGWSLWLTLWAIAGYGAHSVFVSRYGQADTFLPIAALALLIAIALRELERTTRPQWAATVATGLLCALLIRDFALSPDSALEALALPDLKAPEKYHPRGAWAALLAGFAAALTLVLGGGPEQRPSPAAQWRAVRTHFRSSRSAKVWLGIAALVMFGLMVAAVVAAVAPKQLGQSTLVTKWLRRAGLIPIALALVVVLVPMVRHFYTRLGSLRVWPLLVSGLLIGAYTSHVFLPKLSASYSPRSVFETYNRIAKEGEPLAQFKLSGRAATYYAKGEVRGVSNLQALVKHLQSESRTWAVLPGDELPRLDRLYRRRTGKHVYTADARSTKAVLVSSAPVEGHADQNFLASAVLEHAPAKIDRPLETVFDGKIKLLGYDLKLPHKDHVGAGEKMRFTWYFEVLESVKGNYRPFVHIDGADRVHGDHVPVGGKYPVRLWERGDVVMDRHTVEVPTSTKAGTYTIYVGFFSGDKRLEVKEGPKDRANRAKAGVLRIQ